MAVTIDPNVTEEYRLSIEAGKNFLGYTIVQYAAQIDSLIRATDSKTLLDYGSGKGEAWTKLALREQLRLEAVTCYDPAAVEFAEKPAGVFDGVVCCDVLEHIPEPLVDAVIDELFAYATKFVWASVCCRPASKHFRLEDSPLYGLNMHLTVKPFAWWRQKFERRKLRWELVESP